MKDKYEEFMFNVKVDLWTHELLRYVKDKDGANSMRELIHKYLSEQLSENEINEVTRRADLRHEYLELTGKGD